MPQFVGSVLAFREEEPGVTVYYHAAFGVQADSKEGARRGLLEKAKADWPETGGWHSHRVAVNSLNSLIDRLRKNDPGYASHTLYVGSQYATQNRGDGLNENSVVMVSAGSVQCAETLFRDWVNSRYPEADGWTAHSVIYKTLEQLLAEG